MLWSLTSATDDAFRPAVPTAVPVPPRSNG
jgi:hypothetical protein